MNALETYHVTDSRYTVEEETHYNTFEVLMSRVEAGELSFDEAVAEYRTRELADTAIQAA